ncbi:hypothetical protein Tco_0418688 [Tanacetum coccineum]
MKHGPEDGVAMIRSTQDEGGLAESDKAVDPHRRVYGRGDYSKVFSLAGSGGDHEETCKSSWRASKYGVRGSRECEICSLWRDIERYWHVKPDGLQEQESIEMCRAPGGPGGWGMRGWGEGFFPGSSDGLDAVKIVTLAGERGKWCMGKIEPRIMTRGPRGLMDSLVPGSMHIGGEGVSSVRWFLVKVWSTVAIHNSLKDHVLVVEKRGYGGMRRGVWSMFVTCMRDDDRLSDESCGVSQPNSETARGTGVTSRHASRRGSGGAWTVSIGRAAVRRADPGKCQRDLRRVNSLYREVVTLTVYWLIGAGHERASSSITCADGHVEELGFGARVGECGGIDKLDLFAVGYDEESTGVLECTGKRMSWRDLGFGLGELARGQLHASIDGVEYGLYQDREAVVDMGSVNKGVTPRNNKYTRMGFRWMMCEHRGCQRDSTRSMLASVDDVTFVCDDFQGPGAACMGVLVLLPMRVWDRPRGRLGVKRYCRDQACWTGAHSSALQCAVGAVWEALEYSASAAMESGSAEEVTDCRTRGESVCDMCGYQVALRCFVTGFYSLPSLTLMKARVDSVWFTLKVEPRCEESCYDRGGTVVVCGHSVWSGSRESAARRGMAEGRLGVLFNVAVECAALSKQDVEFLKYVRSMMSDALWVALGVDEAIGLGECEEIREGTSRSEREGQGAFILESGHSGWGAWAGRGRVHSKASHCGMKGRERECSGGWSGSRLSLKLTGAQGDGEESIWKGGREGFDSGRGAGGGVQALRRLGGRPGVNGGGVDLACGGAGNKERPDQGWHLDGNSSLWELCCILSKDGSGRGHSGRIGGAEMVSGFGIHDRMEDWRWVLWSELGGVCLGPESDLDERVWSRELRRVMIVVGGPCRCSNVVGCDVLNSLGVGIGYVDGIHAHKEKELRILNHDQYGATVTDIRIEVAILSVVTGACDVGSTRIGDSNPRGSVWPYGIERWGEMLFVMVMYGIRASLLRESLEIVMHIEPFRGAWDFEHEFSLGGGGSVLRSVKQLALLGRRRVGIGCPPKGTIHVREWSVSVVLGGAGVRMQLWDRNEAGTHYERCNSPHTGSRAVASSDSGYYGTHDGGMGVGNTCEVRVMGVGEWMHCQHVDLHEIMNGGDDNTEIDQYLGIKCAELMTTEMIEFGGRDFTSNDQSGSYSFLQD